METNGGQGPADGGGEPPVSGGPRWRALILVMGASVIASATIAVLGLSGASQVISVGALFSGTIAMVSGLTLFWRGWRGPLRAAYRRLLGAALALWAVGQLWNAGAVLLGTETFPTPGDLISLCAAPIAVLGGLTVPRRTAGPHPGWRLGLDSLLLGVTFALLCWHFLFADLIVSGPFEMTEAVAVVIIVADITIVCLGLLAFVRDLDRDLLLVSLGAACYSVGDLITMHANLQSPGQWPWEGAMLWCLAWPLIAAGLLRYRPVPTTDPGQEQPVDPDARGVVITTTVSLAVLVLGLGVLSVEESTDRVGMSLIMAAVVLFWARELLNSRFRAQLLRRLHDEATADPLTGLANRRGLAAWMDALPAGEPWCLLTLDLDGFKDVNDLLGHATGDRLLAAVARRLTDALPDGAVASRIGGDEFAVLVPGDISAGQRAGEQILTAVRQSAADVEGVARVEVSASVGVAALHAGDQGPQTIVLPDSPALPPGVLHPGALPAVTEPAPAATQDGPLPGVALAGTNGGGMEPGNGAATPAAGLPAVTALAGQAAPLAAPVAPIDGPPTAPHAPTRAGRSVVDSLGVLSASGAALRVAKAGGRNRVEVYDASVARLRRRRLRVEERLRVAVETGDITVLYQPIIDLRRGQVAGAEALARWRDPELGVVDPGEFIPVAEQTGLVVALGERVLDETLRAGVEEGLFDRGLRMSCNVSPVQLRVAGFHRVVEEALAAHGVDRRRLVVEVTEQVVVEEGQAVQTLHRLADLGVSIAIDDFGTGYSALGYLQRLPAEVLKIDRSLTTSLVQEPRSRAITRAVLDLGKTVGLSVVVEGVESGQVADLVGRMGVQYGQGTHYGQAMTAAELAEMADQYAARRS